MGFELSDITGADPGKGAKSSSGFELSDITNPVAGNPSTGGRNLIGGTLDPNTQFSQFRFQPKTNADNYLLRAQDQGFWESLGKTLGNTISNIPLDIVQGLGYLGTTLEFGDDRDYNNALISGIEKMKNPFGQVYQEHPDQYFDMGDSAWWLNNIGQLAESSASFAIEGAGIAKVLGTLAKTAAWSVRSAKLGAKVAQGLDAVALTYMEGAMSGAQIYQGAYDTNYNKFLHQGLDANTADEHAKHIASQAAAATVQLHTIMNLGLNMTGLTPLFRDPDQAIVRWWKTKGAIQPGETAGQWAQRISEAVPEGMPLKKLLGLGMQGPSRLGVEAFQEGLEEVNTQYAEHVGRKIGNQEEDKDVGKRLFDMEGYFNEVLNQEGALNMVLGGLGGLAQTVLLDHMPVHKVIKYGTDGKPLLTEQGQPQIERVSSHTMNERMNRQYFDDIKDALSKDMTWFSTKNKEMEDALKSGDTAALARSRADLLSVHNLRAISMGMGDVWKNKYQDIASLDNSRSIGEQLQPQLDALTQQMQDAFNSGDTDTANKINAQRLQLQDQQQNLMDTTEAMQKGYAQDKSDNKYRERALQAIQNLDYLTKLYGDMQDKYSAPEFAEAGVGEHMFYRQANMFLHKQQLDMMEQDLMKLRARIDEMTLTHQDNILVSQAQQFLGDKDVWDTTVKKLNGDITRLNDAMKTGNNTVLLQLLDKYKIPATKNAGKDLVDKIQKRKDELQRRADQTNKELNDTIAVWKETNPDGDIKSVLKRASERPVLEDVYKQNKAYLEQGRLEHDIAKEQLAKDSTYDAIQKFVKENQPSKTKDKFDKQHIEAYNQQLDREIASNLDAKQKQEATVRLGDRIKAIDSELSAKNSQLTELRRLGNGITGFFKNLSKRVANREAISNLQSEIYSLSHERAVLLQRQKAMTQQAATATQQAQNTARTPAPVVQPVTQVTPSSTPAPNTQVQPATTETGPDFSDTLPFDFAQEMVPEFSTIEQGNTAFDNLVGGNEAGTALRQFIQTKRNADVPFLINAVKTLIQRTNMEMPSQEAFDKFITPYVTALKNAFMSQKLSPAEDYASLKSFLKPAVLTVLDVLEGEFREHGFSYDRAMQVLNQQVKEGNLEKNMVGMVATRMKAYLDDVAQPVVEQTSTLPAADTTEGVATREFNEEPTTYIAPVAHSEPTVFSNASLDTEIVQEDQKRFVGASNIEAVKANFNTNPYLEFDDGKKIRIVADYTKLDPKLNTDLLLPGIIAPGDDVTLQVDEDWAGEINYDTEMMQDEYGEQLRKADMFQNYLDASGKIATGSSASHPKGAHANVPIKIIHEKTGKVIGYLPRADWVLAKYPDTANYRNVVDQYQDEDTTVTDNVARQYARIMKLRQAIVNSWNTDKSLTLKTKVSDRGTGHVMLNREVNPNTGTTKLVNRSAKNMLPDPSLEIAVMKQGNAYVASGIISQKQIQKMPAFLKDASSLPIVMLPSADGSHVPAPLYTHRLGDNPSSLNTMVKAIEFYLRSAAGTATDLKAIERIREATGFDLRSPEGLRNFINQYFTYTQKFGEKDTVITPSEVSGNANAQFMLDIPDLEPGQKIAFIKIGTSFSGEKPLYAQLVNDGLHPDFEQALRDGLADRFKNVIFPGKDLRGINTPGEFKAPIIKKDGSVQINTYKDYNEFVKASSSTYVYGLNKVGNQYVYMANPVVQLDYTKALQDALPATSATLTTPVTKAEPQELTNPEEDELADLFGNGVLSPQRSVTPVPTPAKGEQVSLEFLQELRNLTPEAHRNAKTPEEVLKELLERGVTVLADGHNPFYTC